MAGFEWLISLVLQVRSSIALKMAEHEEHLIRQQTAPCAGPSAPSSLGAAAEYARCRIALDQLERDNASAYHDVHLGLLFAGADAVPVRQRTKLVRTIGEQASVLENAHGYNSADWEPGSSQVDVAFGELAAGEMQKLFSELEVSLAQGDALRHSYKLFRPCRTLWWMCMASSMWCST